MELTVVIVNFNTKDLLRDCLESIFSQTKGIDCKMIVVDNGSTDNSTAMVEKEFPKARLIKNKKNLGFAKANNQALRLAQGEYVLLLNSDAKIVNNALAKMVKFAKSDKKIGIVGPKLLSLDGAPQLSTAPFYTLPITAISLFRGDRFLRRSYKGIKEVDWVSGACFLIKREVIEKIGFLDEKFFMYVEEMEFCFRAKEAGYQVYFYPQAEVIHLVRGSSNVGKQKAIWGIYQGLIYFYQKHFAPWQIDMLKLLLRTKAVGAWLVGFLTANNYLKETYAKAFKLVR